MKQGTAANRSGAVAEGAIYGILMARGYDIQTHYPLCESIYGHKVRTDLYVTGIPGYPNGLAIESKWQETGGSADEKFPYLVTNIREMFPCPAIVVVDGGGQKRGSIRWLKEQVDGAHLLGVFTLSEFLSWTLSTLPPAVREVPA